MSNDSFGIARLVRTPGVETRTTLSSNRLPPRLRNMARGFLESGFINGGWSSKSAKVAELYRAYFNLPRVRSYSYGAVMVSPYSARLPADVIAQAIEMLDADKLLYAVEREATASRRGIVVSVHFDSHCEREYTDTKNLLRNMAAGLRQEGLWLKYNTKQMGAQAGTLIAAGFRQHPEIAERHAQALAAFDSGEELVIDAHDEKFSV
jgi:hypothetical protein